MPLDWTGNIERNFYSEHDRFGEEYTPTLRRGRFGNYVGGRCCGAMTVMSE